MDSQNNFRRPTVDLTVERQTGKITKECTPDNQIGNKLHMEHGDYDRNKRLNNGTGENKTVREHKPTMRSGNGISKQIKKQKSPTLERLRNHIK